MLRYFIHKHRSRLLKKNETMQVKDYVLFSLESDDSELSASIWLSGGMNGLDIMQFQCFVNLIKQYNNNALEEKETEMIMFTPA